MPSGTLLYAQSGGVTAVINATASAVITEARRRKIKVLAARNGILGVLREDLIDTSAEPAASIRGLAHTPGGAFGSCRVKLKSLAEETRAVPKPYRITHQAFPSGSTTSSTAPLST